MKKILILGLLAFSLFSCNEDNNDTLTGSENVGGLIDVKSNLVGYVVGNGNTFDYSAKFSTNHFAAPTVLKVDVYKQFFNAAGNSEKVLLQSIDLNGSPATEESNFQFNYNQLIDGLTIAGSPLPSDDSLLQIGDYWELSYKATRSDGQQVGQVKTTKVSVGTRFAGTYRVVQCDYWRIGTLRPDVTGGFLGTLVTIESVNSTTYKKIEYVGPFPGNTFYFTIDSSDNVLVPVNYDGAVQLLNAQPAINCGSNPSDMINACSVAGPQNVAVRDNVDLKDRLYMSYGYLASTGPREFYEVLEKVVE